MSIWYNDIPYEIFCENQQENQGIKNLNITITYPQKPTIRNTLVGIATDTLSLVTLFPRAICSGIAVLWKVGKNQQYFTQQKRKLTIATKLSAWGFKRTAAKTNHISVMSDNSPHKQQQQNTSKLAYLLQDKTTRERTVSCPSSGMQQVESLITENQSACVATCSVPSPPIPPKIINHDEKVEEQLSKHRSHKRIHSFSTFDDSILTQLQLAAPESSKTILDAKTACILRKFLPTFHRLATKWKLIYSTQLDGFSLKTLFSHSKRSSSPTLLVIRDANNAVFGAFITEPLHPRLFHYGTGECFLWKLTSTTELSLKNLALNDENNSLVGEKVVQVYPATGKNEYYVFSEPSFLAVGCSDGVFGLWLDDLLLNGCSERVATFDNDILTNGGSKFTCKDAELWTFDTGL